MQRFGFSGVLKMKSPLDVLALMVLDSEGRRIAVKYRAPPPAPVPLQPEAAPSQVSSGADPFGEYGVQRKLEQELHEALMRIKNRAEGGFLAGVVGFCGRNAAAGVLRRPRLFESFLRAFQRRLFIVQVSLQWAWASGTFVSTRRPRRTLQTS